MKIIHPNPAQRKEPQNVSGYFMMKTFYISFISLLTACSNSDSGTNDIKGTDTVSVTKNSITADTIAKEATSQTKLSVIVLPPYDAIANAGISPDIQKYLETAISKDASLKLIKFPYRQLMNVPYQNVFDKKFCKPIVDKVKTDIIVMSKLDQVNKTGNTATDKWNFQIRIYNTNTDKQINSSIAADKLTDSEVKNILSDRQRNLTTEIKNNR